MNSMVRLLTALLVGCAVVVVGHLLVGPLESGSVAWLGVVGVALFATSLVDREHFYGPRPPG